VWLAELAPISDASLVAATVAGVPLLGVDGLRARLDERTRGANC